MSSLLTYTQGPQPQITGPRILEASGSYSGFHCSEPSPCLPRELVRGDDIHLRHLRPHTYGEVKVLQAFSFQFSVTPLSASCCACSKEVLTLRPPELQVGLHLSIPVQPHPQPSHTLSNMLPISLGALALVAGAASAYKCSDITIPVTISARNGVFNVKPTQNNIEVTNFILNGVRQGTNASAMVLEGYQTISGSYNLAATYCTPDSGSGSIVQLLTHGIGFDRSYWNLPFNGYN